MTRVQTLKTDQPSARPGVSTEPSGRVAQLSPQPGTQSEGKSSRQGPLADASSSSEPDETSRQGASARGISHFPSPRTNSPLSQRGDQEVKLYCLKPSWARMMDFWLGGYHNFAVDRLAARQVESTLPEAPELWREQRRFLQRAVAYMAQELGLDQFIGFGSGLPTRGNIHEIVQAINPAAKVIYADANFTCVAQARDILNGNPNVGYEQCDAAEPGALLYAQVTSQMFGDNHRVGISFSGLGHFLSDEELAKSFATLYEWAAEGSCMAVMAINRRVERFPKLKQILVREGMSFFPRSEQEMLALLGPWRLTEHGIATGPYWGLSEGPIRTKEVIAETSFSFLVCKG